jgi:hypothetical protein
MPFVNSLLHDPINNKVSAEEALRREMRRHKRSLVDGIAAEIDPARFDALVNKINVLRRPSMPQRHKLKQKPNGKSRPITDFDEHNYAQQRMLARVIRASGNHVNHYFDSVDDAIETSICAATEGYVYGVQLDIKNCFPSQRASWFREALGLPEAVVKNVIAAPPFEERWVRPWKLIRNVTPEQRDLFHRGFPGLPQGGAVSSIASAIMLSAVTAPLRKMALVVGYGDDMLVLSPSRDVAGDAERVARTLFAGKLNKYGKLELKTCRQIDMREGVDFLGAYIRVGPKGLVARPSDERFTRLASEITHRINKGHGRAKVCAYIDHWAESKGYWSSAMSFAGRLKSLSVEADLFAGRGDPDTLVGRARAETRDAGYLPEKGFHDKLSFFHRRGFWPMPNLYRGKGGWVDFRDALGGHHE